MKKYRDYFQFPEPITKVFIRETVDKNGCKTDFLVINEKWKLVPTNNPEKPFKKIKLRKKISQNEEKVVQ